MNSDKVIISQDEVVGIAKLKVVTSDNFPHEIPMLSFIVAKTDTRYVSICIHLLIESYGDTPDNGHK